MKGIVLAGGTGTRLRPLTKGVNKHLLPVGRQPMICHALEHMSAVDVVDVLVVTGASTVGPLSEVLGDGTEWGVHITYRVQAQPGGIAQALGLGRRFAASHPVLVMLGDNILTDSLQPHVHRFLQRGQGAMVFLKSVQNPTAYGVARLVDDRVQEILEKPPSPPSSFAVTGVYLYDHQVFDFIDDLRPSDRGEYEITDVNNRYASLGQLDYALLNGAWTDAGTFDGLACANHIVSARCASGSVTTEEAGTP